MRRLDGSNSPAAVTENDATASLEAAAMCCADDFGLGGSASQN
jgi:hypothetical protein